MKWRFWKKVMEHKPPHVHTNNCVFCGKHVLRQSTLDEFADITGLLQSKLPINFDEYEHEVTEKVGMGSKPRKYRGSI